MVLCPQDPAPLVVNWLSNRRLQSDGAALRASPRLSREALDAQRLLR